MNEFSSSDAASYTFLIIIACILILPFQMLSHKPVLNDTSPSDDDAPVDTALTIDTFSHQCEY